MFEDLQFRGTQWYLAEEVDERIKVMEAQINLLKIDVEGLDKENRILMKKSDAWDGWVGSGKQTLDMLADNIESVRKYLNELEDTGGFIDKQKILRLLEAEG